MVAPMKKERTTPHHHAMNELRHMLAPMHRMLCGQEEGHFWLESDDVESFASVLASLQNLTSVSIHQLQFPDARLACECLGLEHLPGEERYAVEQADVPIAITNDAYGEMVVDFCFTDATLKDLATGLWLNDQGVAQAL
jgi:hypothetical protein